MVIIPVESDGNKKTPGPDDQPHPDKSFYENLPFHGLKQPPTEVDSAWLLLLLMCSYSTGDQSSSIS